MSVLYVKSSAVETQMLAFLGEYELCMHVWRKMMVNYRLNQIKLLLMVSYGESIFTEKNLTKIHYCS